ncbi:MAG: DeoR/GlpR transcriptional regulator [Rhodospirillales bacterium]|jgi:DeoR family transcriptional regulator, glycerol-3-phosphate regulon repressor|nr:DeoR/GlpR transcriptional regulator [Rhodospirillales bacterium]
MNRRNTPTVLSNKRQAQILNAVRMHGSISIMDLALELDVSDETIRRNVKVLAGEGLLDKFRGGVMMPDALSEPAFPLRMNEGKEAKQRIAAQIASQINDGDSLILDNGSTTAYIAQALTDHENLLVVTNSVVVANILAIQPGNRVFMAGGELRHHNGGAFGPETLEFVKKFEVQCAVFSAAAIHHEKGFLVHHLCEAEFAHAIIQRSERTYIAADSRKFGKKAPLRLCEASQINELVTECQPPKEMAQMLIDNEIKITIAD